ncbi:MAG: aldehyde dehydrogenase family protein [Planctomycetota bacterium]|nr:aldehyde dehydrogenase family protein [Planctomycetota bacterium]
MTEALLARGPSNFIDGAWHALPTGTEIESRDPARPDRVVWSAGVDGAAVAAAVAAARRAGASWGALEVEDRIAALERWRAAATERVDRLAGLITLETGKIESEAKAEAGLIAGKVDITLGPHSSGRIAGYEVQAGARVGRCSFRPHGVMAVLGPFNFPAHLPNGHIVPALLAGNTIVFKPSDKTPAVGQALAEIAEEAGLPAGVFNLVQGGVGPASELVADDGVDGILFTGSWPVGRRILEANLDRPGRIVALELGGSNPAVVMPDADLRQAVVECARAAFATTGQRCTCTRRIVLHKDVADRFIPAFCKVASTLLVGPGDSASPAFMGPLISTEAVDAVLAFQDELHARGGKVLVEASRLERPGHFITPGVVLVDRFERDRDRECFGPLVQLSIADDLDDCIAQANATRYGLAAAIFTSDDAIWDRFLAECRSGCINRNCGTAGASGQLPFGGLGHSGNHRPAGAFSVDYCAYPVASMVEMGVAAPIPPGMLLEDRWLDG